MSTLFCLAGALVLLVIGCALKHSSDLDDQEGK